MRIALPFVIALAFAFSAYAAVDGVDVTLTGGEVVGKTWGLGTAKVSARITNTTGRTLEGIRLAAWYSPSDVLPPAGADWRIHEFVFQPPLASGAATTLQFSDDNAARYVLLEARQVKYRPALRYDGVTTDLKLPLLQRGDATYIALRDLVEVTGGRLRSEGGAPVIERGGSVIQLKPNSPTASVDSRQLSLANPVFEDSGRSYIALKDAATLLGLSLSDLGEEAWELK